MRRVADAASRCIVLNVLIPLPLDALAKADAMRPI
jgi:hypothetical protein